MSIPDNLSNRKTRGDSEEVGHGQKAFDGKIRFEEKDTYARANERDSEGNPSHIIKGFSIPIFIDVSTHDLIVLISIMDQWNKH